MGLSILIPVYNYEVSSLVKSLADQLKKTGKQGEIIILDDCSDSYFISKNKVTSEIPNVSFYQNERNEGREAARKKLSRLAKEDNLLFLDCDCELIYENFLAVYFGLIAENIPLASGGTSIHVLNLQIVNLYCIGNM
ncbi:MAG: glycosyltransferase [Chitinophagaceae bacterium]|nr:glycosyltransferase [Chitinophagaceae bacterium]